jgi:hypothetical protein
VKPTEIKKPNMSNVLQILGWAVLALGQFALYRQNMNPDPRILVQTSGDGWSVLNDGTRSNIWIVYTKRLQTPTNGYVYASFEKEAKP